MTYTPAADYNGPASFTYTVTDNGTTNGAPIAQDDRHRRRHRHRGQRRADGRRRLRRPSAEDGTLTFTASDLTANDSTGPANENRPDADRHAVDPTAGRHARHRHRSSPARVTYTPDADFNGPATASPTRSATTAPPTALPTSRPTPPPSASPSPRSTTRPRRTTTRRPSPRTARSRPGTTAGQRLRPGPANESGQTLTVTAVAQRARHGSVSLAAGTITYTPDRRLQRRGQLHLHGHRRRHDQRRRRSARGRPAPSTSPSPRSTTRRRRRTTARPWPRTAPSDARRRARQRQHRSGQRERRRRLTVTAVSPPAHGTAAVDAAGKIRYTRPRPTTTAPTVHLHGHRQRHDQRRHRLQVGHRHGQRHRHRGQRRADGGQRQREPWPRTRNVLVDVLANDATGPAERVGQALTIIAVGARRTEPRCDPVRQGQLHAERRLQRPRQLHLHGHRQRHDQRRQRLQVGHRHGHRDRHRGQRRTDGSRRLAHGRRGWVCDRRNGHLIANDSPGPANESGQTLTVTAVGSATHGNVSLNGMTGEVTFTPDADYNGPASFTYTVRDNGTTNGSADYQDRHRHRRMSR